MPNPTPMPNPSRSSGDAVRRARMNYLTTLRLHERAIIATLEDVRREIATLQTPDATETPTPSPTEPSASPRFADTGRPELINPYAAVRPAAS